MEAKSIHSDDLYGSERLEDSLVRHADRGVEGLRDGVLSDLAR